MKNFKFGFTLAEVLITLAIIGVVAALTLPTLMSNYRKKEVETKLVKFHATVNNALQMAEAEHGDREHWDPVRPGQLTKDEEGNYKEGTPSIWVKKYLIPYIVGYIQFKEVDGQIYYYLNDGSCFSVLNASFLYYPKCIKNYEVDEDNNMNVRWGVDGFTFYYNPVPEKDAQKPSGRGIAPYKYAWDGDIDTLKNHPKLGCYKGSHAQHPYCAALIQANGWKIPNDYPYHF